MCIPVIHDQDAQGTTEAVLVVTDSVRFGIADGLLRERVQQYKYVLFAEAPIGDPLKQAIT